MTPLELLLARLGADGFAVQVETDADRDTGFKVQLWRLSSDVVMVECRRAPTVLAALERMRIVRDSYLPPGTSSADEMLPHPPHPTTFEPGDPNTGRSCIVCGFNVPQGCRYIHADWCARRRAALKTPPEPKAT